MRKLILSILALILYSSSYGVNPQRTTNDVTDKKESVNFEGTYIDGVKRTSKWWVEVKIRKSEGKKGKYNVTVHSSKVKSRECCSFNKMGMVRNDTLFIEITEWEHPVTAFITKNEDSITFDVLEKQADDRYVLNWYCCGGGSLIGNYKTVSAKVNNKQSKVELRNTTWTLVDIKQNGTSLPILLDYTTLKFYNDKSFVANFCREIKGNYKVSTDNKIVFSSLTKSVKNNCDETSTIPTKTKLPNIGVAEDILLLGNLRAKIEDNQLFLSNNKGALIFNIIRRVN